MTNTGRPWYPFYVGDYARKTAHLSLLEHGAYRLLLDHYYATREPLPADHTKLFRICRARSPSERKAVLSVTAEFFTQTGTLMRSEKCDSEISKSLDYSKSQSANAQRRHSHGNAIAYARARVPQPQSHKEEKKGADAPLEKKATRLSISELPDEWLEWAKSNTQFDEKMIRFRWDCFVDYWKAASGQNASKLDWLATWRNWIRNTNKGASNAGNNYNNGASAGRNDSLARATAEGFARAVGVDVPKGS